ncbi:MAG: HNH endonuclease [Selenomonadaceae bacterium]|nr:HNH endonuclease [Selenomonadaceae bacterium]MBR1730471.1 HNH endonuclease [Selenomonadaceae bacterium]
MKIEEARAHLLAIIPQMNEKTQEAITTVLGEPKTEIPKVEYVDEKHVSFKGHLYRRDSSGHYSRTEYLHKTIYEEGQKCIIPKGYEIHHIDFDPSNNELRNLEMLTKSEHQKKHHQQERVERICPACGKTFMARVRKRSIQSFCSQNCSRRFNRSKLVEGYQEKRQEAGEISKNCVVCGKPIKSHKWNPHKKYCSHACAQKAFRQRNGRKYYYRIAKCEFCGKEFKTRSDNKTKCCSKSCAAKLRHLKSKNK